ncbi:MAG: 1-acyl-sn-glycerol-3-phosphate acyltransferase [Lachnospiraceae bacterium]|nr:1-acyl-sn-glycerol-3-phosphate acyltransferase [Lachnospiraceae bacterium]
MLRFCWVIFISLPFVIYYICKAEYVCRHKDIYSEKYRFNVAKHMIKVVKTNAFIRTKAYGLENLPKKGGYVMYPNHQGKYDVLGMLDEFDRPVSVMIDEKRSKMLLTDQFIKLVNGVRLNRDDFRAQVGVFNRVREGLTKGKRYIIFPEGGYHGNRNRVLDFLPGAFKYAVKAKSPIVPVALIDSYKPFEIPSLKPVTTQVHFLEPLYYEDYKDMNTKEIAEAVRTRIVDAIDAYT